MTLTQIRNDEEGAKDRYSKVDEMCQRERERDLQTDRQRQIETDRDRQRQKDREEHITLEQLYTENSIQEVYTENVV